MGTRYTESHEYIRVEGEMGTVGITDFAQSPLLADGAYSGILILIFSSSPVDLVYYLNCW